MHFDIPQSNFGQLDQLASLGNELNDYSITNHSIHLSGPTIARLSQSNNLFLTRQQRKQMGLCSQCVGSAGTKTTQCNTLYPDTSHISRQRSSHLTGESIYGESLTGIPNDGAFFPFARGGSSLKHALMFVMKVHIKSPNSDSCQLRVSNMFISPGTSYFYCFHVSSRRVSPVLFLEFPLFLFKPKSIFGE